MTGPLGGEGIRPPDSRMITNPIVSQASSPRPSHHRHAPEPEYYEDGAAVRPFIVTGGRTRPHSQMRIEAQVFATAGVHPPGLDFEHRRIVEFCAHPRSIAEISSAMRLPLGVSRILVADLAAGGAVVVQEPVSGLSLAVLERILERVHAL
jgi:hypothetical protein